jgi:hypothetical protein
MAANAIYPKGRQAFARGQINWDADDIRVAFLDATYVYSDTHATMANVPGGAIVATSAALTGKSSVDGIMDAADVIQAGVSGDTITQLVVYKNGGALILFYDQTAASVLINLAPDGTSVRARWSNGPLKMFRL